VEVTLFFQLPPGLADREAAFWHLLADGLDGFA